jgi:hypothetical protein
MLMQDHSFRILLASTAPSLKRHKLNKVLMIFMQFIEYRLHRKFSGI